jgi:hypothetical protein
MVGGSEASECTDPGQPNDFRDWRWARLSCSALWRILEARVDPIRVVVMDVVPEKPTQMLLVEHDHMVNQFALA